MTNQYSQFLSHEAALGSTPVSGDLIDPATGFPYKGQADAAPALGGPGAPVVVTPAAGGETTMNNTQQSGSLWDALARAVSTGASNAGKAATNSLGQTIQNMENSIGAAIAKTPVGQQLQQGAIQGQIQQLTSSPIFWVVVIAWILL